MGDKNKVHYFVLSGPLVTRNVKTVSFWSTGLLFYFIFLNFPAQDHVGVDHAGPYNLAAGRCAGPVPAVVAVHATTGRTAPGSRLCPAAAGSPPPAGQGPPGPVPGMAATVR